MSARPNLSLIVAMTGDRVIGRDNALPWHLPEDLAHFKRLTMGHPIVMGRRTYESIGRPLPGRHNIVVTRNRAWHADRVSVAGSLEQAVDLAAGSDPVDEIFVIGGAQLYRLALPLASRLYVTLVQAAIEGDTFFPEVDCDRWRLVSRSALRRSSAGVYSFRTYVRKTGQV